MQIRQAEFLDCSSVAKMHREYLDKSFLGTLGEHFLTILYKSLVEWNNGILIIAENGGRAIGFVAGVANTSKFYRYFLKNYCIKAGFILLSKVFNPDTRRKIIETLRYSKRDEDILLPKAELLSIAVSENYQGKGAGKRLFNELAKEFHSRGVNKFKITVGSELLKARSFYKKIGCRKMGEIEVHKGYKSENYVFEEGGRSVTS